MILVAAFGWHFYQKKLHQHQVLGVSILKKEEMIFPLTSEFKHYSLLKPDAVVNAQESWMPYPAISRYNHDGLNDRTNYSLQKPAGTFRIVALGDSFTYGHYVNTAESWPEQLEALLNLQTQTCQFKNFEVLNLGVHGFDVPYIAKRYQEVGAKYHPDLIIWFESGFEFSRVNEIEVPITEACLDSQKGSTQSAIMNCWDKGVAYRDQHFSQQQLTSIIGASLQSFLESRKGTTTWFVSFSSLAELNQQKMANWLKPYDDVSRFFTVPDLKNIQGTFPDGHPNSVGHQTIAKIVDKLILERYCQPQ